MGSNFRSDGGLWEFEATLSHGPELPGPLLFDLFCRRVGSLPDEDIYMKNFKFQSRSISFVLLTVVLAVAYATAQSNTPTEKILFSFPANSDLGNTPNGYLISDGAGNFYGVNLYGGLGSGAVYELSPPTDGGWTAKSIYVFPKEAFFPGALVMDSSGNLFGTEYSGGTGTCTDGYGNYSCGAVYELSPDGSGGWSEQIIWNGSQTGGWRPTSLALGPDGNLYGTTIYSDQGYGGTVFELQRVGEKWNETVLRAFGQPGIDDGTEPQGPLVFDKAGNIYGATFLGGASGGGTVFELMKTKGGWQQTNLFQFGSFRGETTGYGPGGVIFDKAGNLYGTGSGNDGVAFELTPMSSGSWQEIVLETFLLYGPGGYYPEALVFDSTGNLYGAVGSGTSSEGGDSQGDGAVFQLKPSTDGTWSELILHSFPSETGDGKYPSGLLADSHGNLYGTTTSGGSAGVGTVFEITP